MKPAAGGAADDPDATGDDLVGGLGAGEQGAGVAGEGLIGQPDVAAVSFVGSTEVGRAVYDAPPPAASESRRWAEPKNHVVELPDADLDQAADAVVSAALGSAGQRCMAISAAVGDVAEPLLEAVKERVEQLRVGPANAPGSEMGPVIEAAARDRVGEHVDRGTAAGARVVVDGRSVDDAPEGGFLVQPTVLDGVTPGMPVYDDEVFGPLLSVTRVGVHFYAREGRHEPLTRRRADRRAARLPPTGPSASTPRTRSGHAAGTRPTSVRRRPSR